MGFRSVKFPDAREGDETATSSALRAFALIEQIAIADVPPTLEELTSASGLPKPTAYRILRLLMDNGLVERELRGKRYAVGPRLCALSLSVQMRSPRRRERQAILARLVDAIGETCNLTMLDGQEVVYVDRVETSANVRLHMQAGSRVPLHCTASGKLLLAQMAPDQVARLLGTGPLARYTERTIVSMDALMHALDKIRATGVGTDIGEYLEGSVCLAVPIRDARGHVCAAIAVHGPAPRMTLKKGYTFLPAMREAAVSLASTLFQSFEPDAGPGRVRVPHANGIAA